MALGRENLSICLQDGDRSNNNYNYNYNLAFPRGGPERGNPAMTTKRLRQGVKETHQHKCCGENRKMEGSNNIVVYLCGVRAWISINLFTRRAICLQDGEGSNDNNNNLAFPRGGPERGNPAMTTKRLRQGVKETHQHKCCGKNIRNVTIYQKGYNSIKKW